LIELLVAGRRNIDEAPFEVYAFYNARLVMLVKFRTNRARCMLTVFEGSDAFECYAEVVWVQKPSGVIEELDILDES
jgi:hypothetical protein